MCCVGYGKPGITERSHQMSGHVIAKPEALLGNRKCVISVMTQGGRVRESRLLGSGYGWV